MLNSNQIQVYVLYASETGNCEQISEDLASSLKINHAKSFPEIASLKRASLNDYKKIKLDSKDSLKVCVIICSSTGDGDSPENGEFFRRFLLREAKKD